MLNLSQSKAFFIAAAIATFSFSLYSFPVFGKKQTLAPDKVEALKWYLECLKNKSTSPKLMIKILATFVSSSIIPKDEKNLIKNQEILKNNIGAFLGLHDIEKGVNQPDSSFKESKFAIHSLVERYQEILDFENTLLNIIKSFEQPGFMVTCLQPNDVIAFKSSNCPDIKYHELQGKSFLTFVQNNVKTADKLMTILDQSHPVYGTISNILVIQNEILESFQTGIQLNNQAQFLKNQYEFRLKLGSKNQPSDPIKALTRHKKLIEKVKQDVDVLTQLQAMPQQLTDLLIEGAPVRNRLFLQNNDYIEPIFKD